MSYLKNPLTPPIVDRFGVNYHNKQNAGLFTSDNIQGTFTDKMIPYFSFAEVGFTVTPEQLQTIRDIHNYPTILLADYEFRRDPDEESFLYLIVPVVLGSDISPFSTYSLLSGIDEYKLSFFYTEEQCLDTYGKDLETLYQANTLPGDVNNNPGILYIAHKFYPRAGEEPVFYDVSEPTYLQVRDGGKGSQKHKIGHALRYMEAKSGIVKNYVKVSVTNTSNEILGYKTVDEFVESPTSALLRLSFTLPLDQDTEVTISSTPLDTTVGNISQDIIDKFSPTVSKDTQFFITPSLGGDFGGSGTYVIPAGSTEFTVPIVLDPNTQIAQSCIYRYQFAEDNKDIVSVNNDVSVIARSFAYSDNEPDTYGYYATYKLKTLDGMRTLASGDFYGSVDLRSVVSGLYLLEVNLSNIDKVEFEFRASMGQSIGPAKRPTVYPCLNWCSHDMLSGNIHSTLYGEKDATLKYRISLGQDENFEFISALDFLESSGTLEPDNKVEILL